MKPAFRWRKPIGRGAASTAAFAACVAIPKCFGCVIAYLGIGASLGTRPAIELCGAASPMNLRPWAWLLAAVVGLLIGTIYFRWALQTKLAKAPRRAGPMAT